MANYFVGDVQGCFDELELVLNKVGFNPSIDCLWAVGDLIARGQGSLQTLQYFKSLQGSAKVVLGNHDLHLLGVHGKIKRANPKDNLGELLASPDIGALVDWLRLQPLYQEYPEQNILMTHAGIPPQWDLSTLRNKADIVAEALQQPDYLTALIAKMYTNSVAHCSDDLSELDKKIYTINALTRMRYLYPDGRLDFDCKLPIEQCDNSQLSPWFTHQAILRPEHTLVFGHWAAIMGEVNSPALQALDTGCCWGEHLTLWHLESDQKITQNKLKES
ncbi:symmetrical bis(5'-nucleosyl)-tetraphosphatase [Shewanella gelidimarina]|uniref:symmetrical bis(5'-nucleosyl)-tetraphosphatase n=1 Tax=Shewanella gelidimarina TaxID=56813 RepID=UPI00200ED2B3|nr:symmetrical bis(5'-nucleosyl)-tetraphosphatase [Shewanella gelidimarina]MCL1058529.1 symmetrical bis(5'-nucleosyl)-tetraphosphatase [Shewanella gelidimarina]